MSVSITQVLALAKRQAIVFGSIGIDSIAPNLANDGIVFTLVDATTHEIPLVAMDIMPASLYVSGGGVVAKANDSNKLNNQEPSFYLDYSNLTNVPTNLTDFIDDLNGIFRLSTNTTDDITEGAVKKFVTTTEKDLIATIEGKVDKVEGKVLSTNDYTTAEKTKLNDLPDTTQLGVLFDGKVSVEVGKVLSDNNYSNADKAIVDAIQTDGSGDLFLANDGSYKLTGDSSTELIYELGTVEESDKDFIYDSSKNWQHTQWDNHTALLKTSFGDYEVKIIGNSENAFGFEPPVGTFLSLAIAEVKSETELGVVNVSAIGEWSGGMGNDFVLQIENGTANTSMNSLMWMPEQRLLRVIVDSDAQGLPRAMTASDLASLINSSFVVAGIFNATIMSGGNIVPNTYQFAGGSGGAVNATTTIFTPDVEETGVVEIQAIGVLRGVQGNNVNVVLVKTDNGTGDSIADWDDLTKTLTITFDSYEIGVPFDIMSGSIQPALMTSPMISEMFQTYFISSGVIPEGSYQLTGGFSGVDNARVTIQDVDGIEGGKLYVECINSLKETAGNDVTIIIQRTTNDTGTDYVDWDDVTKTMTISVDSNGMGEPRAIMAGNIESLLNSTPEVFQRFFVRMVEGGDLVEGIYFPVGGIDGVYADGEYIIYKFQKEVVNIPVDFRTSGDGYKTLADNGIYQENKQKYINHQASSVPLATGIVTSTIDNTLTDNSKSWTINQFADKVIRISRNGGEDFQFAIVQANTSNTLILDSEPVATILPDDDFLIMDTIVLTNDDLNIILALDISQGNVGVILPLVSDLNERKYVHAYVEKSNGSFNAPIICRGTNTQLMQKYGTLEYYQEGVRLYSHRYLIDHWDILSTFGVSRYTFGYFSNPIAITDTAFQRVSLVDTDFTIDSKRRFSRKIYDGSTWLRYTSLFRRTFRVNTTIHFDKTGGGATVADVSLAVYRKSTDTVEVLDHRISTARLTVEGQATVTLISPVDLSFGDMVIPVVRRDSGTIVVQAGSHFDITEI